MFVGIPDLSGGLINEQNQSLPQCRCLGWVGHRSWSWGNGLELLAHWNSLFSSCTWQPEWWSVDGLLMAFSTVSDVCFHHDYHDPKSSEMMVITHVSWMKESGVNSNASAFSYSLLTGVVSPPGFPNHQLLWCGQSSRDVVVREADNSTQSTERSEGTPWHSRPRHFQENQKLR